MQEEVDRELPTAYRPRTTAQPRRHLQNVKRRVKSTRGIGSTCIGPRVLFSEACEATMPALRKIITTSKQAPGFDGRYNRVLRTSCPTPDIHGGLCLLSNATQDTM